ncbi:MAG: ABC transporter ATP-binding protein [Saprospiraceae bacterium]|jgi:putative ABC transport system ATP-binding protein
MLKLANINKTYHPGTQYAVPALHQLDLELPKGTFCIVIGGNGSGKSTLLNTIAGTIFPDSGDIYINQQRVTSLKAFERSKFVARVFQNPHAGTAPNLSVLENFRLAALRTQKKKLSIGLGRSFEKATQENIADLGLGLENKINQPMGTLSGGQRQALSLLMSALDDTQLLLLDEPTAALDPKSSALVMQTANHLIEKKHLTTIWVTHHLKTVIDYGSRVILMEQGKIKKDLEGEKKRHLTLQELYSWFA